MSHSFAVFWLAQYALARRSIEKSQQVGRRLALVLDHTRLGVPWPPQNHDIVEVQDLIKSSALIQVNGLKSILFTVQAQ